MNKNKNNSRDKIMNEKIKTLRKYIAIAKKTDPTFITRDFRLGLDKTASEYKSMHNKLIKKLKRNIARGRKFDSSESNCSKFG